MPLHTHPLLRQAAALVLVITTACGGSTADPPGPAPVAQVEVSGIPAAPLQVQAAVQLAATARDAQGRPLTGRSFTWQSSDDNVATVDVTGRVLAVSPGVTSITATSEGRSGSAQLTVTASRIRGDQPDDLAGAQVHVMYVVPADGEDRGLDANGTLRRSVASFHGWFMQRSGLAFRFDTHNGELDISHFRLRRTDAEVRSSGAFVVSSIEVELREAGWLQPDKLYLVYYDGGSTYACGGAAWPPLVPGQVAAMYLKGTPQGFSCAGQPFVSSPADFPRYWEFAALHDLVHALGVVAPHAPNHTDAYPAHVPEPHDLMYSGPTAWILNNTTTIDVGGDDYHGAAVPTGVVRLADSPFLAAAPVAALARLRPLTLQQTADLAAAVAALPVHEPFGSLPHDQRDVYSCTNSITLRATFQSVPGRMPCPRLKM